MNKYQLSVLMLILTLNLSSQEMAFQIKFSENYATFEFLRHLPEDYPQNAFKTKFENSEYNKEKYRLLIDEFNSINYFYWYEYPQYPYGNKIGGNTYFILGRNLIESTTLEGFKTKSFGIIPNADLERLYHILSEFLPIYQEIIFNPSKELFNAQLSSVKSLIKKVDVNSLFTKALNFHKSTWDYSIPFLVSLYPIPDSRSKGFTATAFYNQAVAGIPQGLTDYELLLSVMFHEAFHILYDEQSLRIKQDIAQWFENSPSDKKRYAQLLFNEAVTTSLANGYLYREFTGKLLEGDWYNNKYIAQMAEKMFPLVESYLDNEKSIDEEFIQAYINLFANKFPDWFTDPDFLLMQRFVISDNKNAYATLYKDHSYANISEYRSKLNALTIEEMKTHPVTKIIIITDQHKLKLGIVKKGFKELNNWHPDPEEHFSHVQFLEDHTYLIIINSKTENISQLLEELEF